MARQDRESWEYLGYGKTFWDLDGNLCVGSGITCNIIPLGIVLFMCCLDSDSFFFLISFDIYHCSAALYLLIFGVYMFCFLFL